MRVGQWIKRSDSTKTSLPQTHNTNRNFPNGKKRKQIGYIHINKGRYGNVGKLLLFAVDDRTHRKYWFGYPFFALYFDRKKK